MLSPRAEQALYLVLAALGLALGYVVIDGVGADLTAAESPAATAAAKKAPAPAAEKVIQEGDTAPDFSVTTAAGRKLTRSDFGGRVLVLNFWASYCEPCRREMPALNELQRQLAGSGVVVLGISVDEDEPAYRKALKDFNIVFETAWDPSKGISNSYGTLLFPETYIINRQGRVTTKFVNEQPWTDPSVVNRIKSAL